MHRSALTSFCIYPSLHPAGHSKTCSQPQKGMGG